MEAVGVTVNLALRALATAAMVVFAIHLWGGSRWRQRSRPPNGRAIRALARVWTALAAMFAWQFLGVLDVRYDVFPFMDLRAATLHPVWGSPVYLWVVVEIVRLWRALQGE